MVICNKCYNEHHDQCMGKAGSLIVAVFVLENQ